MMKMEMGDVLVSVEEKRKKEYISREIFRTPFSFSFLLIFIPSSSLSFLLFLSARIATIYISSMWQGSVY